MPITEHQRNTLHNTLTENLGTEVADTMMELLPPVGWADVATKRDLDVLGLRIDASEQRTATRIAEAEKRMLIAMISTMLATVIAVSGMAFAAAGLT